MRSSILLVVAMLALALITLMLPSLSALVERSLQPNALSWR
jgi:hypothetical protein